MFDILLDESQKRIKYEVRRFVKEKVDAQLIKDMDAGEVQYPREYVQALGEAGLLGLRFPVKYGGKGCDWVTEMAAIEEIGVLGGSLACLYSLPSIVGECLERFGSENQKEKYLKPTIEGKLFTAEALTEPRGGSDFFGATTTATFKDGYYYLNGQKRFVVGSEGADYFMVYAKTSQDKPAHQSLSVFIVERDMGVTVKHVYGLMGTRGGGTGRLIFTDTKVPAENLVGQEGQGAQIFNRMMLPERMTSAAGALGMARAALEVAAKYSTKRKAFGQTIKKFQAVSFKVADSVAALDAARSLVYTAARYIDLDLDARRMVSEAKKIATETLWAVVNNAMQVMGGIGYTNVFPVERFLRDARLSLIWTGTNEIMDLLIQHEYYKELAAEKPDKRDVEKDAIEADAKDEKVYE